MRQLFANLVLMAIVAISASSCTKSDIIEDKVNTGETFTLYATTEALDTKATFEYNEDHSISFDWVDDAENEDQITLYDSKGDIAGNFKCTNSNTSAFVAVDGVTLTNGEYTAVFPATTEETLSNAREKDLVSTQNGDAISSLNNACYMEGTFTYSSGDDNTTVQLEHQMAVITFQMGTNKPEKLIFKNGDYTTYTVNYSDDVKPTDGDNYRSHIMINPCAGTERTLVFTITYADDSEVTYTTTSTKEYKAGMNYTAPFTTISDPSYWSGEGTEGSPYLIETAADLRQLSTSVNSGNSYSGKFFKVTDGIDLDNTAFTAIGSYLYPFKGTFDGNSQTISGLYISTSSNYQGLFGYIYSATVKNITVSGSVTGGDYVGGVVGRAYSSTITYCNNYATANATTSQAMVGGIVGNSEYSSVTNCSNNAKVSSTASEAYIGGIAGQIEYISEVVNCYNTAEVSCTGSGSYVGGVVGSIYQYSTVANSYNRAEVSGTGSSSYVGGVVGYNDTSTSSSTVITCYNCAEIVSGTGSSVGGVVGYNNSKISYSYYDSSIYSGGSVAGNSGSGSTETLCSGYPTGTMQSEGTVKDLNGYATYSGSCGWTYNAGDYPTLNYNSTPN